MKTRFSILGSAPLLLATASLQAHSFYGNLRGQPLAHLPSAIPSLSNLIHAGFEVQNNAVAAMAELQLPAKTRVGAAYSHFSHQGFYGFGSWSPIKRLQVMGLINQQQQVGGYGRVAIIQGRLQGFQTGVAMQLGTPLLNVIESWKAASLKSMGQSLLENWGVQIYFGWAKFSFRPLHSLSYYFQLGIDALQDGEGHVFEALRSLEASSENLAPGNEHEQQQTTAVVETPSQTDVVGEAGQENNENQAPPSSAPEAQVEQAQGEKVKEASPETLAASATSTQETLSEMTTTQTETDSNTHFLPLKEPDLGNPMPATLPAIEVFNELSFGCTEKEFSQLSPLVQLVLKCGVLHERLLPGENPGEAFWCNEDPNQNFFPHDLIKQANIAWGMQLGHFEHSQNLIFDASGEEKGRNCFILIETGQVERLYFPGLDASAKQNLKDRLEDYEKENPNENILSLLREQSQKLSISEEDFPEFFLGASYYSNGRHQGKEGLLYFEDNCFSWAQVLKLGRRYSCK